MRKINKSYEPVELTNWKRKNPHARYADLQNDAEGIAARQAINRQNIADQYGLCAYCCKRINENNSLNEHLVPRDKDHLKELDFNNIVASCNTSKQCDDAHKSQFLPLTPLMPECEEELKFCLSGKVEGKTDRANSSIKILNLNNNSLRQIRKQLIEVLIFTQGYEDSSKLTIEKDEVLSLFIEELQQPQENRLEPFSPALTNILRNYLNPLE